MNSLSQEIHSLRGEMNVKLADIRTEIATVRSEISTVKSEVIKWVFGISFAQAALILSVLKFFH